MREREKERRVRRWASVLRRIAGMPDYQAYIAHLREHHPECPIPDEKEYFALYLEGRYRAGGSRCC
ncbi:MAG: YbdD/YjiX family protein [Gemmatimonadales bacterium]